MYPRDWANSSSPISEAGVWGRRKSSRVRGRSGEKAEGELRVKQRDGDKVRGGLQVWGRRLEVKDQVGEVEKQRRRLD